MLAEKHEVIITNNGRPNALMIEIDDENFEDVLISIRQAMVMRAVNKLRMDSIEIGRSEMTSGQINAEISKTRKEKLNDKGGN
jgi:hypothetical protein